ncbi:MAG TPA: addiction module protein [Rhizomicrobium sp.]|jgi:putative addiction module component (TIGR02574 family)
MNKVDDAWMVLRKLPQPEQERIAEAILDYAARADDFGLTDEQAAEVERRLAEIDGGSVTLSEARARMAKLYS